MSGLSRVDVNNLFIFLIIVSLTIGCTKEDDPAVSTTLKEKAIFGVGAAVSVAHLKEADFAVKLFYNDYDIVINSAKRTAVKALVARFRKDGYPIDGLGEQCHTSIWTDKYLRSSGFTDLAKTGLLMHISELDVRVNQNKSDSYVFTDAEQQKQSDNYKAIAEMFEILPQAQKFAITTWGLTDNYTWLTGWWHPKEYPLLFDNNYNKKKAYYGFLEGLN